MKNYLAVGVGLLAGTVIGAAAVSGPHAQEKPSLYLITEIDVFDPEGYEQEFVPKASNNHYPYEEWSHRISPLTIQIWTSLNCTMVFCCVSGLVSETRQAGATNRACTT
jgi:hypothetical protein